MKWLREHRRILAACAGALMLGGTVAINVVAYWHARAMTRFAASGARTASPEELSPIAKIGVLLTGINVPRPTSDRATADLHPACQDLLIEGRDGVWLSAWYTDVGEESPLVIMFHGYATEKTTLLPEAREFLAMGASVLLVDFRGSGGSSESYTTVGVREGDDVATAVAYARTQLKHQRIILFGRSMGSAAILRAVSEHDTVVDGVIIEAVFDTMLNTARNRFKTMGLPSFPAAQLLVFWGGWQWNFNGFSNNPVDHARSLECPSLFMHGTRDPRVTLPQARAVFDNVSGPKTFVEFEAVEHAAYAPENPERWRDAVAKLIQSSRQ